MLADRPPWTWSEAGPLTGRGVTVGMVDSGWDHALPIASVRPGVAFVDPLDDLALLHGHDDHDRIGHGTLCTQFLLQIAPSVAVVPLRVFGKRLETSPPTIVAAIKWATDNGVGLLNLSLGTAGTDWMPQLYRACSDARDAGVIIVAAARGMSFPASFEPVISVGAARYRTPFNYSYWPDNAVECLSLGHRRAWNRGRIVRTAGSSFAAPNITGLIALMLERWPGLALKDVRAALKEYATEPNT